MTQLSLGDAKNRELVVNTWCSGIVIQPICLTRGNALGTSPESGFFASARKPNPDAHCLSGVLVVNMCITLMMTCIRYGSAVALVPVVPPCAAGIKCPRLGQLRIPVDLINILSLDDQPGQLLTYESFSAN
jgi:hypothetical protein